jgi:hypothetical protein
VLYTGSGNAQSITGLGLTPDMTWIKSRSNANSHVIHDNVRSTNGTAYLLPDLTTAEQTGANGFVSLDSNGFSLDGAGGGGEVNTSSRTYVAWNWKANGSGSSNTNGSINTTATSANIDAGFSIITYSGNGTSGATIGHGLSKAPEFFTVKRRSSGGDDWQTYYGDNTDFLRLNSTSATADNAAIWNDTSPSNSLITLGNHAEVNSSGETYVCYAFHSVDGYSKVGSYTGNANTDGTFVYTGFRPMLILTKSTERSEHWRMRDTVRDTDNPLNTHLEGSASGAEQTNASVDIDILSNGFKLRSSDSGVNANGEKWIYIAFAETPFKYSNAR